MSAEARIQGLIDDAVRRATEPLERAVDELSARLAAVEGSGGPADADPQKRPSRGRTRSKTQPAEATATADDAMAAEDAKTVPAQREASE